MRSQVRRPFGDVACLCAGIILLMSAAAWSTRPAPLATSVIGAVWKADNTPLPNAKLRLRNVATGRIQGTAVANQAGRFVFGDLEAGPYIVELVSDRGKLLAIGNTLAVGPGETVATFIRMGTKIPWFDGFFGNAASVVASAAASTGITAMAPEEMPCASPPCR